MISFIEQMQTVLKDMQRDLLEVRRERREKMASVTELDAEEIEILQAIAKTKETLEQLGAGEL